MDFDLTQEQEMIRDSVKKFLEKECPKDKIRELKEDKKGYAPDCWSKMVELGWMGLVLPEVYGGSEMGYMDLIIMMEEMGRNLLPAPFFATVGLCSLPLLEFGTEEQKSKILPKIAEGEIWTLAVLEASGEYNAEGIKMSAKLDGDGYVLDGTKLFVPYANVANNMIVIARTDDKISGQGLTAFVIESDAPGISITVMPTTAHDMKCEVVFNGVRVSQDNILGKKDMAWDIMEYIINNATLLKCAEMSGGAQAVLNMSTDYARERIQFDKPIGSFQAVQHKLANMLIDVEGLKFLIYEAATKINNKSSLNKLVHMAKAKANQVYQKICIDGIQIHGAIGFTEELDAGLYHIQSKAYEFELGGQDFQLERIASELEDLKPDFLSL